jgi:hypothetical protein
MRSLYQTQCCAGKQKSELREQVSQISISDQQDKRVEELQQAECEGYYMKCHNVLDDGALDDDPQHHDETHPHTAQFPKQGKLCKQEGTHQVAEADNRKEEETGKKEGEEG